MSAVALANPSLSRFTRRKPCDRAQAQETERQLLLSYHRSGDLAAREELAERLLPLARDLAARYTYTDEPFDDLLQVASLGLVKAIDRFDPERGTKFTSYAAPTILGELKRHFRDKGWALHVPRDLQERTLAVNRATEALSKQLGRSPKAREVAAELNCSVEAVLEAQEAGTAYDTSSLDQPLSGTEDESGSLLDTLGGIEAGYEFVEMSVAVGPTVRALPPREQEILRLRFIDDLTQREIGERVGVSQMHVSRLLRRALDKVTAAAEAA